MFLIFLVGIVAWVLWLWLGKRMVRPHRAAILDTAILPTLLALATVVFGLGNPDFVEKVIVEEYAMLDILLLVGFALVAVATFSSVGFAIKRKWEIAKGIGFGSGIGFVALLIVFILADIISL